VSIEENKALVRRCFDWVFNAGSVDEFEAIFANGYLDHEGLQTLDRTSFMRGLQRQRALTARYRVKVYDLLADGDKVVARWSGPLAPTNGGPMRTRSLI
jgi:predicted SnoaL-like aldol condensation-catalyzing enzyme